jgi:hypothetical protein
MVIEYQQIKANHICMKGLPNYNYCRMYMEYNGNKNTRDEYNFQNAKAAIAAYTLNYAYAYTTSVQGERYKKPLYVNQMSINIGSTADDKSNSADPNQKIVEVVMGTSIFADASSTEALKKGMALKIIRTQMKQPTTEEKKSAKDAGLEPPEERMVTEEKYMPKESNPRNAKVLWSSEFGGILADTKKAYMAGYIETLCDMYSGKMDNKTNCADGYGTVQYVVSVIGQEPFLSVCGSMTPEGLIYLDKRDIGKGVARFQWMCTLGYEQLQLPDNVDIEKIESVGDSFSRTAQSKNSMSEYALRGIAIINMGSIIANLLHGQKIEIEFDPAAIAVLLNHERDMRRHLSGNKMSLILTSRQLENAYKDCMLLAIGNLPYYVYANEKRFDDDSDIIIKDETTDVDIDKFFKWAAGFDIGKISKYKLGTLIITPDMARYVCKLYDRIYTPSAIEIGGIIQSYKEKPSKQEEFVEFMNSSQRITKKEVSALYKANFDKYKKQKLEERKYAKPADVEMIDKLIAEKEAALKHEASFFSGLPDETIITTNTRREAVRKLHLSIVELQPVVNSLVQIGSMVIFEKSHNVVQYVYVPSDDMITLPSDNYVDYVGVDKYNNACVLSVQDENNYIDCMTQYSEMYDDSLDI